MMESSEHKHETTTSGNVHYRADGEVTSELLEQEVERLHEELEAERERGLRTLAEFDNYRRRVRQERARADLAGQRRILLALLDVMDDFERALEHMGKASDAVADGLRLIHQRLGHVLESHGVTPFESVGEMFNPALHEAMSVIDTDEYEHGMVSAEDRRGYLWNGELLRPARVAVVS